MRSLWRSQSNQVFGSTLVSLDTSHRAQTASFVIWSCHLTLISSVASASGRHSVCAITCLITSNTCMEDSWHNQCLEELHVQFHGHTGAAENLISTWRCHSISIVLTNIHRIRETGRSAQRSTPKYLNESVYSTEQQGSRVPHWRVHCTEPSQCIQLNRKGAVSLTDLSTVQSPVTSKGTSNTVFHQVRVKNTDTSPPSN